MNDYTIIIQGPDGIILDAEIDASLRKVRRLSLDDAALRALLILTSVAGGAVEAEIVMQRQNAEAGRSARAPFTKEDAR
jgi:hypothetical protein